MGKTTTNSSRGGEPLLSKRLRLLHEQYHQEEHIWDIGCDHGLLGLSFLNDGRVKSIHLVDPSLPVIERLRTKPLDSYISIRKLYIHHQRGQDIIPSLSSNCLFIAGMGGKEIGDIITALLPQLGADSRIVISPHRKILELRKLLNGLPLALVSEGSLEEENQFYQVLSLRPHTEGARVSLYGEAIWKGDVGQRYREQQIRTMSAHQDRASRAYLQYLMSLTT